MKIWIASAGALLLLTACGASKEATAALEAMSLGTGTSSETLKYTGKSGSGDDVTLKGVTFGPAGSEQIKAATVKLGGLDMNEAGKPVVKSVTLTNVGPAEKMADGATLNLKTLTIDGLNPVTGAFIASAFGKETAEPPPLEQWGFSKISFNGLTFAADGAAIGQPGTVNVEMGEFSISDLKDTVFGGVHLSGLKGAFDVPDPTPMKGTFDFGVADIKNVRGKIYGDAVMAGMASAMGGGAADTSVVSSLTSPLEAGYDSFTWSGLNLDATGLKISMSKVEQKLTRNEQGVVTAMSMPRATFTLSAESAGGTLGQQATMLMAMVGYPGNKVEIYGGGDATYDPASDTTRYKDYSVGLTDVMDIKLNGGFQGVTKALSAFMTAAMAVDSTGAADPFAEPKPGDTPPSVPEPDFSSVVNALKVVDLDVTFTDKAMVNMIMGAGSMFMGADPEQMRTDVVNQIMAMAGDTKGVDKTVTKEFTTALGAFVKQPGTLNIKLKPAQPLSLADSKAPATKAALGFSATFTPTPGTTPAPPAPAKPN